MFLVVHVFVASSEAKHDLAIVFHLWMLNMAKRNMYRCQVGGLCALYYVHVAKLKLCFQNSLPGSRLRLATRKICIRFERQNYSRFAKL